MPIYFTLRSFYSMCAFLACQCEEYSVLRTQYFESAEAIRWFGALQMSRTTFFKIIEKLNMLDWYRFELPAWNEADPGVIPVHLEHDIFKDMRIWASSHDVAHIFVAFILWHIKHAGDGRYEVKAKVADLLPATVVPRVGTHSWLEAVYIRNALAAHFERTVNSAGRAHFAFMHGCFPAVRMIVDNANPASAPPSAPNGLGGTLGMHHEQAEEGASAVGEEIVAQASGPTTPSPEKGYGISIDVLAQFLLADVV